MSHFKRRQIRELLAFTWQKQKKLVLVCTLLLITINLSSINQSLFSIYRESTALAYHFATTSLTSLLAVSLPFILFDYLNNKTELDFLANTPLSPLKLFQCQLVSGLSMLLGIYLVGFLSNVLVAFYFTGWQPFHLVIGLGSVIIISLLFLTALTALLLTNTALDSAIIIGISLFILPLIITNFDIVFYQVFNFTLFTSSNIYAYLSVLLASFKYFDLAQQVLNQITYDHVVFLTELVQLVAYHLIIMFGLTWLTTFLLKKRKVENINSALNNTLAYKNLLLMTVLNLQILTTIPMLFQSHRWLWFYLATLFPLLVSTLVYAAMLVFVERSYHNFLPQLKRYGLIGIITHISLLIIYRL